MKLAELVLLGVLGLTKKRSDFPSLAAAFHYMRRRLRGKENRVGSKRWGVAIGGGIQDPRKIALCDSVIGSR